jgi:HK97 family phage major capsid protein
MNRRLAKLQDRQAELVRDMDGILAAASDEDRELTEEENTRIAASEEEIARVGRQIELEKRIDARRGELGEVATLPRTRAPSADRPRFSSFGEQLTAVARAGMNGGMDPRLISAGPSGQSEQVPADGGFLVQPEFSNELLKNTYDSGLLASLVRRRPIGPNANGIKMNAVVDTSRATGSRYGGIQTYWVEEAGLKTASKVKFRPFQLVLKKLCGLCYATDELLEDAVALEAILRDAFTEEFAFVIDDAIFRGTGAGQPLGFLNSPAKITITAESGQGAGTIVLKNVLKMYDAFWSKSKQSASARWFVGNGVQTQLYQMTLGGTATVAGEPIFLPPNGAQGRPLATLLGIPLAEVEQASAVGTEGDISLVDLDQYLMIDKGGMQSASSIHVRFIYDETTFRFVYRCDGAPIWNTAVTPYKGSISQSPIVTLASTRT